MPEKVISKKYGAQGVTVIGFWEIIREKAVQKRIPVHRGDPQLCVWPHPVIFIRHSDLKTAVLGVDRLPSYYIGQISNLVVRAFGLSVGSVFILWQ